MMSPFAIAFISGVIAVHSMTAQASDKEIFVESGSITLKALVHSAKDCSAPSSWRWGAEGSCPKSSLYNIGLRDNNEPIFVPLSAFSDLGNVQEIKIENSPTRGTFGVIILGGEASTSYKATLSFEKGMLLRKTVRSGEFPEDAYEETSYKYNSAE